MGRWIVGVAVTAGVAFALVQVSACSLGIDGTATGLDATSAEASVDAHPSDAFATDGMQDASMPDTAADAGDTGPDAMDCNALGLFFCGTQCVSSCIGCASGSTQCNGNRTCGDCSTCPDGKNGCFACNGGPAVGVCQMPKCNISDSLSCPCAGGDAAVCPGVTQICSGGGTPLCKTCGQGGTDMKQCANGLECDEMMQSCH
jgi:hypothetical protein